MKEYSEMCDAEIEEWIDCFEKYKRETMLSLIKAMKESNESDVNFKPLEKMCKQITEWNEELERARWELKHTQNRID